VGDVLGKYHPHGDQSVYNALVRMAQDFAMRVPLVDGQGNFGSIDGDNPAAMRYTEVRLQRMAELLLADIEKETVDFVPNFDDSLQEPSVLPAAFPNLLVNGASGIAMGMATSIPPHNLGETIDAVIAVIEKPDISIAELMKKLPGPDFPTGGIIMGRSGIREAYHTGTGQIKVRARVAIETLKGGKDALIVNEIPYLVNKTRLIQDIAAHVKGKKIEGITELRDESDRDGIRIVLELKRGVSPHLVMNRLFKLTALESTFGFNMLALDDLKPVVMNVKQLIEKYSAHREEIVQRRTRFDLDKARKRAHVLEGFLLALDNIDEVIRIIRASRTPKEAGERLMERFGFTKMQAEAILDMRLSRLTGLEREKIEKEHKELLELIEELEDILKSKENILRQVVKELKEISRRHGDPRRTEIVEHSEEIDIKDLIVEEDVVVTLSHNGFIKRTPITAFKGQSRGGMGVNVSSLRESDFIERMFVASTHDTMLFITNRGKAYSLEVHEILNAGRGAKGQSIKLMLDMGEEERIAASVALKEKENPFVVFITRTGYVKKVPSSEFQRIRKTGIIAVTLDADDQVVDAVVTDGNSELLITTAWGKALRIGENTVRTMGRTARGVKGIRLGKGDYVCGMIRILKDAELLVVSEKGYGKRVGLDNFTVHGRGTSGQIYMRISGRTGKVMGVLSVTRRDEFVVITERGMIIKLKVKAVSLLGRNAGGVKLVNLREDDAVAGVARIVQE
jgi:DNA gyrase subunit A